MGLHRALVTYARGRVLEGARNPELARDLRARAEEALRHARGAGRYAERAATGRAALREVEFRRRLSPASTPRPGG